MNSNRSRQPAALSPNSAAPPAAGLRRRRAFRRLWAAVLAVVVPALSLPLAAHAAEEVRAVSGFQAVALEGAMTVKVERADQESVHVTATLTGVESVETVLESRKGVPTLVVRQTGRSMFERKTDAVVTVKGPQFKALGVAGSGVLEARLSNQPALQLQMAGSGDLRVLGVTAHQVEVNVAGSGDVRVQGAAQNLSVTVAGSGDAWLQDLEAEDVRVSVAGSGDARVHARQRLRVSVAGSGDVRYSGPARDVSSSVVGSGTVKRL